MDRFIERVTRALIHHENKVGYVEGNVEWRMAPPITTEEVFNSMPLDMQAFLASVEPREIGEGVFRYMGYYSPGEVGSLSLWFMNFYDGVEFMSMFRGKGTPAEKP